MRTCFCAWGLGETGGIGHDYFAAAPEDLLRLFPGNGAMSAPSRLGQKEIALFFFPLLLNVQLMSVSHSVINAFLARQHDYVTALAGFSVAMVLHLFLASPSYQNHTVTIAMVRGRRSLRGTVRFVVLVACYVSLMLALVAFTPVGDLVLKRFLGVNDEIAAAARSALSLLVALPFITGFRGLFQGLVIKARRTTLVSVATAVRIGALLIFLAVGARWFTGAKLGAFALLACVATETAVIGACAWHCEIPAADSDEKGTWEILRFAFPLAYSSCLQQTIPLLINAVISRLPDGPQALAGFGVIRGFLFLLAGPMRNLQQAYLTLVRSAADFSPLVHFGKRVALGLALLLVVTAWPLNRIVLGDIMGLDTVHARLSLPAAGGLRSLSPPLWRLQPAARLVHRPAPHRPARPLDDLQDRLSARRLGAAHRLPGSAAGRGRRDFSPPVR